MNSGVHNCLALADLGAIRTIATGGQPGEIFLSCKQRTISLIFHFMKFEHHTSISVATKLSEQNFENFTIRDHFSKKRKNFSKICNVLRLQAANSATITDRRKFTTKLTLYWIQWRSQKFSMEGFSPLPSIPPPSFPLEVGPLNPAKSSESLGKRCKLPQRGLGQSSSRNRIWCISALKYDIWLQQF